MLGTAVLVVLASAWWTAPAAARGQVGSRVPQGPPGTVTLPVADYDRLLDRAAQPVAHPDPPPVPAVVGRADIRARVTGDTVRGTLRLDGEVFQRGPVRVPLVTGATLLEARTDGRALPVLHEGDSHAAILTGPAPFSVTLDWAASVAATPGRAAFVLPRAAAGSVSATIDLAGDPVDVRVEPGLITRRQTAAGRTTIEITLAPGGRGTQVSWSVREATTQATPAEVRTLADVKSLVTIGDGDLRMVALVDISVVRGEPRTFEVHVPSGYEVSGISGTSLEGSERRGSTVQLTVREPAGRRHQFLLTLEQPHAPGSFKVDTSFPTVAGAQRETGEAAIEGIGTMEVAASGDENLRRMDVRETNASLRSLARQPLLAAFRYQRRPNETRVMTLDVTRFADAPVISAAAEHGTATTLVTSEGRMLTEVALRLRNRAQPFMKVTLPPGATMLSVDVAGETAKPVMGADGTRIPLLRTGFRPDGAYNVSFVYLHAGQAFGKRGDAEMMLPKLDVPISMLEWELFLPERYSVKPIGGNVIPADLVVRTTVMEVDQMGSHGTGTGYGTGRGAGTGYGMGPAQGSGRGMSDRAYGQLMDVTPGRIVGRITDGLGNALPGATITVTGENRASATTVTDQDGVYVLTGVPSGSVTVTAELPGFKTERRRFVFDQRPRRLDFQLPVGALTETVTVTASADVPIVDPRAVAAEQAAERKASEPVQQAPSQNIINLQRRVSGVLPVRVDVPRAGTLYRFVRPLVLEEETTVSFRYKVRG